MENIEEKSPVENAEAAEVKAEIAADEVKAGPGDNVPHVENEASQDPPPPVDEELQAKKALAGEIHFVFDNRVFVPKLKRMTLPGIGKRTAIEICADVKAQEYLLNNGTIGTAITEILLPPADDNE